MRLRLDLAYDGTDFHGWAVQPDVRTVQATLQEALARVLRLDAVQVTCAGRTDAGVHARGQVVHVDVDPTARVSSTVNAPDSAFDFLLTRLNGVLPLDVRVHSVTAAGDGFDARFSALWRRYAYRIADAPALVDPLSRSTVVSWPRRLDLDAMNRAAERLVGERDFAAFCRKRDGATTIRTLQELRWARDGDGLATATVRADAFCHTMVRSLVGSLVAVGEGRREPAWPSDVLRSRQRDPGVRVMRAHGLTLEQVAYPPEEELAAQAQSARVLRTLPSVAADG
ncbi:tRNA pseudouridine(38-40) synthase TruA [soil metagenome]